MPSERPRKTHGGRIARLLLLALAAAAAALGCQGGAPPAAGAPAPERAAAPGTPSAGAPAAPAEPPPPLVVPTAPPQLVALVELPRSPTAAPAPPPPAPLLARRYRDGGRLVVLRADAPAATRRELAADFAGVRDPSPTRDGRAILFAGRRTPRDRWQVWSVPAEGGEPRRVLEHPADCFHPVEQVGGRVVFVATVAAAADTSGRRAATALFVAEPDGSFVQRVTYDAGPVLDPVVLEDGRTAFAALRRTGGDTLPDGRAPLLALNWDGTDYAALQGVLQPPRMRLRPAVLDDGWLAFLGSDDPGDVEGGDLYVTSFYDPLPPPRRVNTAAPGAGWEPAGRFAAASDLGAGVLVVSYRPAPGDGFGLWLVDRASGGRAPLLAAPVDRDLLDAVAVRPAPDGLGRLTRVGPGIAWGWLYCQDARRLGGAAEGAAEGAAIQRVRVIEGRPLPPAVPAAAPDPAAVPVGGAPPLMTERVLGEVPLAEDGSFYLKVPADRPLRLQLLDAAGVAVAGEGGWQWVRPNEARGCVGCHVGGQWAPRNRVLKAVQQPPVDLTAVQGGAVDYRHHVGPVMARSCAVSGCHTGERPTGGRDYRFERAAAPCWRETDGAQRPCEQGFQTLLKTRPGVPPAVGGELVHPGSARTSPLLWMLRGRQLAPQLAAAPFERPLGEPHPPKFDDEETKRLFARWVDLGAPYEAAAPAAPAGAGGWGAP